MAGKSYPMDDKTPLKWHVSICDRFKIMGPIISLEQVKNTVFKFTKNLPLNKLLTVLVDVFFRHYLMKHDGNLALV